MPAGWPQDEPSSPADNRIDPVRVRLREPELERAFLEANRPGLQKFLVLLAALGIAGSLLSLHGAYVALSWSSPAFVATAVARGAILLASAAGLWVAVRRPRPGPLKGVNAALLIVACVGFALRMSTPAEGAALATALFHVSRDGVMLLMALAVAELMLVPCTFIFNAAVLTSALAAFFTWIHLDPTGVPRPLNLLYTAVFGFALILVVGHRFQLLRRRSFLMKTSLEQANRQLTYLATTDPVTGCSNRHHFQIVSGHEITRSERYGGQLAFIALDLDHFKRVNDRHGHSAGDRVLARVGETLRRVVRDADTVARVGGEEFAILLPETDRPGALRAATRVATALRSNPIDIDGEQLQVTASIGVAVYRPGEASHEPMMRRADQALYAAKHAGRDRITVEPDEVTTPVPAG